MNKYLENIPYDKISVSFNTLKINGFYYKKFSVYFLNETFTMFKINDVQKIFIYNNLVDLSDTYNEYNNALKTNDIIFDIKKYKDSFNFCIEQNEIGQIWISQIQKDNKRNLKEIMETIDNFFKKIKYTGLTYISDWSYINNIRTLDYRIPLKLNSIYSKYGYNLVYDIPESLLKEMNKYLTKINILELEKKIKSHTLQGYELKKIIFKELSDIINKIKLYYSFMFKFYNY
jgi:hypothetical protein